LKASKKASGPSLRTTTLETPRHEQRPTKTLGLVVALPKLKGWGLSKNMAYLTEKKWEAVVHPKMAVPFWL